MLPASVRMIGEKAFYRNSLREVTFSSGSALETVGDLAFAGND